MFDIFKNVINNSNFDLRDILLKIEEGYIKSNLTKEQKESLEEMARNNANAEDSYAENSKQIEAIFVELENIKARLDQLEGVKPPVEEEYPEYKQPTGSHDAYNIGDKITFNRVKYTCTMNGCVWSPTEYPSAWSKVE